MATDTFDRDQMARHYARRHLKTDGGIRQIYFLPKQAPDREIRFLEINESLSDRDRDPLEPIDFGVDTGSSTAHSLLVLDITPAQWEKIRSRQLSLPPGWTLDDAVPMAADR